MLKKQIENDEQMYIKIDKIYTQTRILKHDIKHYLTTVLGLLVSESYKEAEQLLIDIIGNKLNSEMLRYGESDVISAVLNTKQEESKKQDIRFDVKVNGIIPKKHEINIAIILSNLLDNAITASAKAKEKLIEVDLSEQKGMYSMTVKNTTDIDVIKANPELKSTKRDKHNHGLGIRSIRQLVKEMDGSISFNQVNEIFEVFIVVPFSDEDKKI